ncbi:STM3941 family protein [Actinomadura rupiterrae]|uniref:STM3941 family protein n=1 Tax=Actinomadura rupiterrae TaxID=559627 RepID=UPI0020A5C53D|nr:STM3941 family protein [Actinomadura rupiterrae]MCP2338336.1 hypothetical protein [Actinomadura rupiterrae]
MSDQASEVRSRWLMLAPFIRRELLMTGRTVEPEAQWIAVNYARLELGRVRGRVRLALLIYILVLGTGLGLLQAFGAIGAPAVAVIAAVVSLPFVLALLAWARGRVIVFNRIITLNDSVPSDTSAWNRTSSTAGPADTSGAAVPEPGRTGSVPGQPLEVRINMRSLTVRFGGIALVLALAAVAMAMIGRNTTPVVVCGAGSLIVFGLLAWVLIRARKHNPMVTLSEEGVRIAGWNTTVPWSRVTGIRVITLNERRGGAHVLALAVDAPETLIATLTGPYARAAERSLSAYATPLSFADRHTDTTAHTVATAAASWTGHPIRTT